MPVNKLIWEESQEKVLYNTSYSEVTLNSIFLVSPQIIEIAPQSLHSMIYKLNNQFKYVKYLDTWKLMRHSVILYFIKYICLFTVVAERVVLTN